MITVIAATRLETRALRRAAPNARIVECGVGLRACDRNALGDEIISCGLAGGLRDDLRTGTVVIADRIRRPSGEEFACDRALVIQLTVAARKLGIEPVISALVTSARIVSAAERERWAQRGYAAADMESGLLEAARIAAVRVILDTPQQELSPAWLHPAIAMLNPLLWPQALWLAANAPRCANAAAAVVAGAVGSRL